MLCSECKESGHNIRTCQKREECPVCFEKLGHKNVSTTKCGHTFCTTCIIKSANRNGECPLCREQLYENLAVKTFLDNKERIMSRSLEQFKILERFPQMVEDEEYKLKIIEDFVHFSHLILFYSLEELTS